MQTFINNRYKIVRQLGKGGMGAVYLVEDVLQGNRLMALKTIRADLLLERNLAQFKYEFAALGELHHPNLVEVYDFWTVANSNDYFFTMEYVPGEDLPNVARRQTNVSPNDYTWLYESTVQVCRALQYIHSRGFIHYDVKSRNIRLTSNGQVKLMDFGLVGEARDSGQLKVRGTPEYIAPELIRGDRVDHRLDLYSLGVTLYESVTGRTPFTGDSSIVVFKQHVETPPEPPRHFVNNLPEKLQAIILKLMAKEPVNRYESANMVIQAINEATNLNFPVETKETKRGYIQSGSFVGRAFELARLQGLLMRTIQGYGHLVLVSGTAGVGKTRLIRELRIRAQMQRVLVCEGICREEARSPYHAWIPILSQIISYQQASNLPALKIYGPILVNLMPELADLIESVVSFDAPLGEEPDDKRGLMEIVVNFLLATDRPLMLVLEDLHYADNGTIELLDYLGKNAKRGRWLICGIYREGELGASHPLNALLETKPLNPETDEAHNQLKTFDSGNRDMLYLTPLTESDSANLVKSMLGVKEFPPGLLSRLMAETGGNPLFIESLMQSLVEEDLLQYDGVTWHIDMAKLSHTPTNIREAAQRRLNRLDRDSLELLQWAAVMGQWLDLDVLAEVCSLKSDDVFQIVAGIARQHVLTVSDHLGQTVYRFSTDQMREVIYQTLSPSELAQRHQQVGQVLREFYGDTEIAEQLAWHFEHSQDWELALRYAKIAADKARQVYANESAAQYYGRVLSYLNHQPTLADPELEYEILAKREDCFRLLGNRRAQRLDIESMMRVATDNKSRQISALTRKVSLSNLLGDYAGAKHAAASAMTLAWQSNNRRLEADSLTSLGEACLRLGEAERARACHDQALHLYEELKNRIGQANSYWHLGNVSRFNEQLDEAHEYFERSLVIYQELAYQRGEAEVLNSLGLLVNNYAEKIRYHQQSLEMMKAVGDLDGQARTSHHLGVIYNKLGDYPQARPYLEKAVQIERDIQGHLQLVQFLESLGQLYLAVSEHSLAQRVFEEGYELAKKENNTLLEARYQIMLGQLALAREQPNEAKDFLLQASEQLHQNDNPSDLARCLAWLGATYLALDNWQSAHRATSEAVGYLESLEYDILGIDIQNNYLTDKPTREVWWWHYQAIKIVYGWVEGEPLSDEAKACLQKAHDAVMSTVAVLDETFQHSYLEKVKINRDIIAEFIKSNQLTEIDELAVQPAKPAEVSRKQTQETFKRILDISVRMGETNDLETLLDYIIDQVMELSSAERGFLMLIDSTGQMNFKVARGVEEGHLERAKVEISYTVIGEVSQSKLPILLADALIDLRFGRQSSVLDLHLRSVLCVPLISRAELIGLFYADSRTVSGRFSEADKDLMSIFANQAAIAIENTRLYEESIRANKELDMWARTLEQRVNERTEELKKANLALSVRATQLQTSSQVGQQLTSILNLDELLDEVVRLIQTSFGYHFVGVWFLTDKKDFVVLRASTDKSNLNLKINPKGEIFQEQDFRISIDAPNIVAEACMTGKNRLVENIGETHYMALTSLPDTCTEFVLPLRVGHEIIGALDLQSNKPSVFSSDSQMVLQLLVNQIAVTVRNAQLYQAESRRRRLAESLEQAGRGLSSSLNMVGVPGRILDELATVVPYERSVVLFQQENELHSSAKRGFPNSEEAKEFRVPIRPGDIYQQIVETRQPIIIDDVTVSSSFQQLPWLPLNHSMMGVPLISKNKIIGMISLTRREAAAFHPDEVYIVLAFASQAAVALENADLYGRITKLNEELEERVQQRTRELNKAYHNLEQFNKTKTDFITISAHELRTPLTVISGYAQILAVNPNLKRDPNFVPIVDGILSGMQQLYEIVNSMLDVAKIDNQTLQMHREQTMLDFVIDQTCAKFKEPLTERRLTLTKTNFVRLPAIQADPQLLMKVFYNLISNAIKYTPDGGFITISSNIVSENGASNMVEVVVSDTGIGIAPANIEMIFEKFYQTGDMALHSSGRTNFKGGGPGLGLAIVKGIVLAHGGKIWAQSNGYDETTCPGSQFYVRLPLK